MAEIRIDNLTKRFGEVVAIDELNFTFEEGAITCLLGPSGCGKTTLLRMIAGLETPTDGRIYFGDKDVTDLPSRKRNLGMVFQYPVVYRGMTVAENVDLPLKTRGLSKKERKARIERVLGILSLEDMADKRQEELDNVTRQKVAVARAVAYQPDIVLFDEPMTNIDANAKIQFKQAFKALTRELNQVIVYVTHDQTEAMTFADKIALMEKGVIAQCASPRRIYGKPRDVFGGWFLGNPGMNFMKGQCKDMGRHCLVSSPLLAKPLVLDQGIDCRKITLGIRPEDITLHGAPQPQAVAAKVRRKSITIGGQYLFSLDIDGTEIKAKAPARVAREFETEQVWLEVDIAGLSLFDQAEKRIEIDLDGSEVKAASA